MAERLGGGVKQLGCDSIWLLISYLASLESLSELCYGKVGFQSLGGGIASLPTLQVRNHLTYWNIFTIPPMLYSVVASLAVWQ